MKGNVKRYLLIKYAKSWTTDLTPCYTVENQLEKVKTEQILFKMPFEVWEAEYPVYCGFDPSVTREKGTPR